MKLKPRQSSIHRRVPTPFWAACLALLLGACNQPESDQQWRSAEPLAPVEQPSNEPTLTLGDIDPDTPMHKVLRIQPLADHLARELGWEGPNRVRIRIARSIEEMATMMADGRVDIFLDSVYPTLAVRELAASQIFLGVVVEKQSDYHALLIVRSGSAIAGLDDLVNQTLSFQERFSTSGYILPSTILINQGYVLEQVSGPDQLPAPGRIGYFFSGDEENTLAMVRNGLVAGGALSSQDYEELPTEVLGEIQVLSRSEVVPRKLASARAGMDAALLDTVTSIFLSISEEDRARMDAESDGRGWRWEFEHMTEASESGVAQVQSMIDTLTASEATD